MKKEYDFSKAKLHKGPLVKANKIQKTFRLDEDVFEWLLLESKKNGMPYQTYMNSVLKKQMKFTFSIEERIDKIEQKLKIKKVA